MEAMQNLEWESRTLALISEKAVEEWGSFFNIVDISNFNWPIRLLLAKLWLFLSPAKMCCKILGVSTYYSQYIYQYADLPNMCPDYRQITQSLLHCAPFFSVQAQDTQSW